MSKKRRKFRPQDKLRLVLEGIADEGVLVQRELDRWLINLSE